MEYEDAPAMFFADIFSQRMEQLRIMVADLNERQLNEDQYRILKAGCELIIDSCRLEKPKADLRSIN